MQGLVLLCLDCFADAKREIQKHLGGIMLDTEEQNPSLVQRPRRPGILGHDERFGLRITVLFPSTTHPSLC